MSGRKNHMVTLGFVVSVSLIAASVSVMLTARHYGRVQFDLLNMLCGEIMEQEPETRKIISAVRNIQVEMPTGRRRLICCQNWGIVHRIFRVPFTGKTAYCKAFCKVCR